jgi:hypothetical protein
MKRISFLLFSFSFVLVAACSGPAANDDDAASNESAVVQKPTSSECDDPTPPLPPPPVPTQCEAKGGRCTGLTPTACPEGFFASASDFSCGSGIGVGCCWACPTLSPPAPSFCPNGTITPKKDEAGCVRGYDCVQSAQTDCEAKGGQCVGLSPSSCVGGAFADYTTHSCGSAIGVGCCIK